MDVKDWVNSFFYFSVNYFRDDWKVNTYERINDDGNWKTYSFDLRRTQEVYIGADFYASRMYASGCRNGQ